MAIQKAGVLCGSCAEPNYKTG